MIGADTDNPTDKETERYTAKEIKRNAEMRHLQRAA